MSVTIRLAKPEDAAKLVRINKAGWLSTYVSKEYKITEKDLLPRFQKGERVRRWRNILENERKTSHWWIAESGSRAVGFASARKMEKCNELGVYILPKFQSAGLGTQLIRKAIKWLGDEKKIEIDVVSYNAKAIRFYAKEGFKKKGKGTFPLQAGKSLPLIKMVRG